jgi:hypothetical protein
VTERAVSFAAGGRLSGVVCEPPAGQARAGAPAIVSCNVGVTHHVGPYRFYVDLARALALRGFTSLRFDLSGLGNSAVRKDALGDRERALDDLLEAMNYLQSRHGQTWFAPVGFCSGVDAAHRAALVHERVRGVCFIEGYAYRTRGFYLRYPARYADISRWRRFACRNMPSSLREVPGFRRLGQYADAFTQEDEVFVRNYPTRIELKRDYEAMSARGTSQLFVYVGGDSPFNHERQFLEFTGLEEIGPTREVVYLPKADHTFFLADDRRHVVDLVASWATRLAPPR